MANEYFHIFSPIDQLDQRVNFDNVGGSELITGIYDSGTSFEFADIYTITVNAVDEVNSLIDVSVYGQTLNTPFDNANITDMTANDSVYVTEVIPGIGIKFNLASVIDVGQQAIVRVGHRLVHGTLTAGDIDDLRASVSRLGVRNIYNKAMSNCKVRVLPKARPENINGNAILKVRCSIDWPSTELAEYTIRFSGYAPGSNQVCQIDGGDDVSIICDGTTETQITTGLFVVFNEADIVTSVDVSTIRVSDGYKFVQLAGEIDGSPDTWVSYSTPAIITEDQNVIGTISPDGIAYFWIRVSIGSDATPSDNVREYRFVVQGDLTS